MYYCQNKFQRFEVYKYSKELPAGPFSTATYFYPKLVRRTRTCFNPAVQSRKTAFQAFRRLLLCCQKKEEKYALQLAQIFAYFFRISNHEITFKIFRLFGKWKPCFGGLQSLTNPTCDFQSYSKTAHTVRKSQIVSKNWIFRKIYKIVNLNFRAKNQSIIVIMIHWFLSHLDFSAKNCQNSIIFNNFWFCTYIKSRFLARKFKLSM